VRGTDAWARRLGAELRAARVEAGVEAAELARQVDVPPEQVEAWERAERLPAPEEAAGVLGALGVVGHQKAWLRALAKHATGTSWILREAPHEPFHYDTLLAHEQHAAAMTGWAPTVVPDLLQIADYARLVSGPALSDQDELEDVVTNRLERNRVLSGAEAVEAVLFVGTTPLENDFGDPEVLLRQIRHLADVAAATGTIQLRIVPDEPAPDEAALGDPVLGKAVPKEAFTLFRLRDLPEVGYRPHHSAGVFLPGDEAATERENVARLAEIALSTEDSLRWLREAGDRLAEVLRQRREADDAALTELLQRGQE
jgi:transcriptional regulator with XRE-family HTH domain